VVSGPIVIAPAGLPRPVLDRLNQAVNAAINAPATRERFAQLGSEGGGTPEEFAALIRRDRRNGPRWCAAQARGSTRSSR
jgi:tripartite-type tricarboxylate transporter receptor subunit TctC